MFGAVFRCSELGSGIAGIELVCGAVCSPVHAFQLHKPMLFLAGGEVSATSASSSGKRGIAKKERKKRSDIHSKISFVCWRRQKIQIVCNVCRMSPMKDKHR